MSNMLNGQAESLFRSSGIGDPPLSWRIRATVRNRPSPWEHKPHNPEMLARHTAGARSLGPQHARRHHPGIKLRGADITDGQRRLAQTQTVSLGVTGDAGGAVIADVRR